ncbi:MAG: hypothetical protein ILA15_01080 [Clostridiales bacterium]|nr:hypothetical protein [Clostridiales bacterium]
MDSSRLKQAFKKAFSVVTAVFSASVVLLAGISALYGELIYPEVVGRLFLVFVMLYFLTVVRMYVAGTRWACNKPYILVNIMFAPLYFGFAVLGLFPGNPFLSAKDLLIAAPTFIISFAIAQIVVYVYKKANTDRMNDALNEFHKEHQNDGYEEELVDGN